ncbi:hypothetical protein [Streptococcus suis]|uniref:hypothetical protein n=1 Tax=Streptococcus suis TaxID=1307 RepID=UPI00209BF390|nr:hypothetical protein [Streptococcus suis]MCO8221051.1 hypothetical protein [Streptococcus suis]HEM3512577.1 hypothetical protein [Streptococcus suis]
MIQDDNKKEHIFSASVPQELKKLSDTLNHVQSHQIKVPVELIATIKNFQNSVNTSNLSPLFTDKNGIFRQQIEQVTKISSVMSTIQMNSPFTDAIKQVSNTYQQMFSENQKFIDTVREMNQTIISSYKVDYSKLFSSLSDFITKLPKPYTREEFEEIAKKLEALADKGWVVYYYQAKLYEELDIEDFTHFEQSWIELLRTDLSTDTKIDELRQLDCFSEPLITSMVDSYHTNNYYAAYTLASLAIDGVLNRLSEISSSGKRIPVGHSAVKEFDKKFVDKHLSDVGLMRWFYNFFKDTNRFSLDKPNRHMIGHGRWEEEITEKMFLQLFNVILYIHDEYDYWVEVIKYQFEG